MVSECRYRIGLEVSVVEDHFVGRWDFDRAGVLGVVGIHQILADKSVGNRRLAETNRHRVRINSGHLGSCNLAWH